MSAPASAVDARELDELDGRIAELLREVLDLRDRSRSMHPAGSARRGAPEVIDLR